MKPGDFDFGTHMRITPELNIDTEARARAKLVACHSRRLPTVTINYKILHEIACVAFVADATGPASIESLNSIGPARPTRQVKGGRNGCR
jgi:hypothetical protein